MTSAIPTRFSKAEIATIDELVAGGAGDTRSAVIRMAVKELAESKRRAQIGAQIAASYREHPQMADDDDIAMANAIAITEAESW